MKNKIIKKRQRTKRRVRSKIKGTPKRPRLSVFRSNRHIYAQAIDDINSLTLISASDMNIKVDKKPKKMDIAKRVGELMGKKLIKKKIKSVVFDKGYYRYAGRVKSLAEGIVNSGIVI